MTGRVLVVDDILANVKLLEARLSAEYFDVLTAYSDFARLQHAFDAALQSASQVLRPSLLDFLR